MTSTMLHRLGLGLLLGTLAACATFDDGATAGEPAGPATIERGELGTTRNVTVFRDLILGGQPSADDLELAKKRGVTRVLNIRTTPELERLDWSEAARCAELDLEYVQISFRGDTATDEVYDAILAVLDRPAPDGGGTLFHCASGNRTALFVALQRMRDDGIPYDQALADAQAAGMKPSSLAPLEAQATRLGLR